jgi:hypothetical protein
MATLSIDDDAVTVELSATEKMGALRGNVTVPRSAIMNARVVPDGMKELHRTRVGTGIPGMLVIGTVRDGASVTFAVCRARRPAVVIDLTGQQYDRLVVSLADAKAKAATLSAAG